MKNTYWLRFVLTLILLVGVFISGCRGSAPAPLSTPTQPGAASSGVEAARTQVLAALQKLATTPHRAASKTQLPDGTAQTGIIEYVPPDRLHVQSDPTQFIVIGQDVYMQEQAGKPWVKAQIPAAQFAYPNFKDLTSEDLQAASYVGEESLSGQVTQRYEAQIPSGGTEQKIRVWIDKATGQVAQLVIEGQAQQISSDGQAQQVAATSTLQFTYDPALKIEAPQVKQ